MSRRCQGVVNTVYRVGDVLSLYCPSLEKEACRWSPHRQGSGGTARTLCFPLLLIYLAQEVWGLFTLFIAFNVLTQRADAKGVESGSAGEMGEIQYR